MKRISTMRRWSPKTRNLEKSRQVSPLLCIGLDECLSENFSRRAEAGPAD